jgi:predicted HTH transcriptional regulator
MVAFANAGGGWIFVGIADGRKIKGANFAINFGTNFGLKFGIERKTAR